MLWKADVPAPVEKVELRKDPVIIRVNKFDEEAATKFQEEMAYAHNTGQKVIPVIIDSYGGQVYSLLAMISAIRHAELPVATIVEGKAMSCGAVLFTFGEDGLRFMDPDATIMIHDVAGGALGKVEDIKATAEEADRLNKKIYTMMARNCGKKDDYFTKITHKKGHADWFLDAEEAKKHNLVNQIRVPTLKMTVTLDIDLE
tara:strand:- start:237 stop:839 length:603 start_codon:yes stop_codon:yes gene_type:complete